jgi:hypothetical protein
MKDTQDSEPRQEADQTVRLPSDWNVRIVQMVNFDGQPAGKPISARGHQFQTQPGAYAPVSFPLQL